MGGLLKRYHGLESILSRVGWYYQDLFLLFSIHRSSFFFFFIEQLLSSSACFLPSAGPAFRAPRQWRMESSDKDSADGRRCRRRSSRAAAARTRNLIRRCCHRRRPAIQPTVSLAIGSRFVKLADPPVTTVFFFFLRERLKLIAMSFFPSISLDSNELTSFASEWRWRGTWLLPVYGRLRMI